MIWNTIKQSWKNCHPCCGFFLQGGIKIIAIISIVHSIFLQIVTIIGVISLYPELNMECDRKKFWTPIIGASVSVFVIRGASIVLSIVLYLGAVRRNILLCKIFIFGTIPVYILATFNILYYVSTNKPPLPHYAVWMLEVLFKPYAWFVVWRFIEEVKSFGGLNQAFGLLKDADLEEFFQGAKEDSFMGSDGKSDENQDDTYENVGKRRGFNLNFEITLDQLRIDKVALGRGAFGEVFRGHFNATTVAVKTTKPFANLTYFKTLLSEVKVMSYIGSHKNVLEFVGVCTANIKQRKLYIVVEFCPYGSLFDYLRTHRSFFVNHLNDESDEFSETPVGMMYYNVRVIDLVSTPELLRWCADIASGMEYLAGKKIVHGDLAARNVLLSSQKTAKITDFGLSRKLYENPMYMKKQNQPLPWRWLAPESLKDLHFSTKSDVWAFGVTLWETFSLSEVPFPGLVWTKDFIQKIEDGLRMKCPKYCSAKMYTLMVKCWETNLENRPDFSELVKQLTEYRKRIFPSFRRKTNTATSPVEESPTDYYNLFGQNARAKPNVYKV